MARRILAKRARRQNPRVDRNIINHIDDILDFGTFEPNAIKENRKEYKRPPQNLYQTFKPKNVDIVPRSIAQEDYIDALNDTGYSIVFAMGPAGTGKTLLSTQFAIRGLIKGDFKKIIITRPAVSVEESHGFLPGGLIEKMAPWCVPILDVIKETFPVSVVEYMLKNEIIEISPLAFMRGRTFKNAIVIADEMQNATKSQMKMLLTRIGENSRMIVTGDLQQHDRGFEANGLKDFIDKLKYRSTSAISVCKFTSNDVERHPVIEEILRIYNEI